MPITIDWNAKKSEILGRIDVKAEAEEFGIRFAGSRPSATGWLPCHNPYQTDRTPSAGFNVGTGHQRGYLVMFNQGEGIRTAVSFWDLVRDFHLRFSGYEFRDILHYYADKTGVPLNLKTITPPTMEHVEHYQGSITDEVRRYLHDVRGLTDESVQKYRIGWATRRERLTYPVFDSHGVLVNIRFHAWKKDQKPKTQNWAGFGDRRLWGIDRLTDAPDGATVCVTTGEWDAMLIEQETGLLAVSPTNGDMAFDSDWVPAFENKNVVLVCDCDKACRQAVEKRFIPAFRTAVRNGVIPSFKIVWLFDDANNKDRKDFTDFITKAGGTGAALHQMIERAATRDFPVPTTNLPAPLPLDSFKDIDDPSYVGRRVTVPLYIHGENSEAYHAPTRVFVGECAGKKKRGCHGRDDWQWSCDEPIPIRVGDRIQMSCVASSDFQMKAHLREYVCDKGLKPVVLVEDTDRLTIREVYAHQILGGTSDSDNELIEKAVYTIGGKNFPIGQYQATGFVHSNPRNQKPTILIDTMEPQEEDWQAFDLERCRPLLRDLQRLSVKELLDDLTYNVTRIYDRHDLHLGVMLTLCSPRWIDFRGEGRIRGWISSVVIGDTGVGKSQTAESIFDYAGVGYRVSGMTSSRTGITYACEYDEKRGWRIKAGAMLKMSGQAMIVDEAQDLEESELKTMAEALDRGKLKIDRIQNKEFQAETRCFFSCNPRDAKRAADQRTMGSYKYGCRAVGDIFPKMMLRRLDLALFAASYDIKDKAVFDREIPSTCPTVVTRENLRALIYFAWNLPSERINVPADVAQVIRREAIRLSAKFGGGQDLPIVYPEDFRKTLHRLCVACAVIDLSSEDDFESILVKRDHVEYIVEELDRIYSARNCQLDKHAEEWEREHSLEDEWATAERLHSHLQDMDGSRRDRVSLIFNELMRLDPENKKEKLSQVYLRDMLDVTRRTVFEDMRMLIDERLVISSRGYLPTPKLFQLWHYLNSLPVEHEHYGIIDIGNAVEAMHGPAMN
jgi:hypothetical protein